MDKTKQIIDTKSKERLHFLGQKKTDLDCAPPFLSPRTRFLSHSPTLIRVLAHPLTHTHALHARSRTACLSNCNPN